MVHQEFDRDVNDVYCTTDSQALGTGLSGTVVRVTHRTTGVEYAMKSLKLTKKKSDIKELRNEVGCGVAGWLGRWLAGSLAGWVAGWLGRWLAGPLAGSLAAAIRQLSLPLSIANHLTHPIPSHPIPSHPIPSHPIPRIPHTPPHPTLPHSTSLHPTPPPSQTTIMSQLDHPNIVRLIEAFYTETHVHLIMEVRPSAHPPTY